MKTWIFEINTNHAKIYLSDQYQDGKAKLVYEIENEWPQRDRQDVSPKFIRYLTEEMELACSIGTDSELVIASDRKVIQTILNSLNTDTKRCIRETMNRNHELLAS